RWPAGGGERPRTAPAATTRCRRRRAPRSRRTRRAPRARRRARGAERARRPAPPAAAAGARAPPTTPSCAGFAGRSSRELPGRDRARLLPAPRGTGDLEIQPVAPALDEVAHQLARVRGRARQQPLRERALLERGARFLEPAVTVLVGDRVEEARPFVDR